MKKIRNSVLLLPLLLLTQAFSDAPQSTVATVEPLIGTWVGAILVDGSPIGIDLEIEQVKTSVNGGVFHYGEPRACRLSIVYITTSADNAWFALQESSGGYCDKLNGKNITLRLADDQKSLVCEILTGESDPETATLQRE